MTRASWTSIERDGGRWLRLAPVLAVVGGLTLYAATSVIQESLGIGSPDPDVAVGVEGYRRVVSADGFVDSLAFSLWVAVAGTGVAVVGAVALAWWWTIRPRRRRAIDVGIVQLNLAIPHAVWAVALAATLSQSGLLARLAAWARLIDAPAEFPVLIQDGAGVGIVIHLATKELPFVLVAVLPLAGRRVAPLLTTAATLGAGPRRRLGSVFLPAVAPALVPATVVAFAYALGAYEAPVVLGGQQHRALAVVALDRFRAPDLATRTEALALSILLAAIVLAVGAGVWASTRRWWRR